MKRKIRMNIKIFFVTVVVVLSITACKYKDIADADYPDQRIYLPAAAGIYSINSIPIQVGSVPTPGSTYRFLMDTSNNKFIVPLGIVRSGINLDGRITVDISLNNDTVAALISKGTISSASILPENKFSIQPSSVIIESGKESALFNISIDLEFLKGFPDSKFALGVSISSKERVVNPLLSNAVILISTKIFTPSANFTFTINSLDKSKYTFLSTSENAVKLNWDFGDGSFDTISKSPVHYYAGSATYLVNLTATGILGGINKSTKSSVVKVVIKPKADFSYVADATDPKKIIFTNKSTKALTYSWDFGDGSALSVEKDPIHTYGGAGSYTVKLTAIGDTGVADKSVKSQIIKVL